MKNNLILSIALALITTPFAAAAQGSAMAAERGAAPTPPVLTSVHNGDATELTDVLAVQPAVPLGPPDLLKAYEEAMAATAQGLDAEVSRITEAVQQNKITEDQGEYLCKEAYQLAMMQFQVLGGLHDMLEVQMTQAPGEAPAENAAPATGLNGSGYHNAVQAIAPGSKGI